MIREATIEDVAEALEWARRFHEYWAMREAVPFDADTMETTLTGLIEGPNGVVFLSDNGIFGGLLYPSYLNAGYIMAQELFWFCDGSDEGLRDRFEVWANSHNANAVIMCYIADERSDAMERLYRMKGYRKLEAQVVKEF